MQMQSKRNAFVALLACMAVCRGGVAANDVAGGALENLSQAIVYVKAFGNFQSGGKAGHYRVILLDATGEYPHSQIYLQWIVQAQSGEVQVVGSQAIAEINNAGVYKLSVPTVSSGQDSNVIDVMAINQYSQNVQNLQIAPGEINHYELRYATGSTTKSVDQAVGAIPLSLDYYVRPTF